MDPLAIVVVLLLAVVAVTLVLWKRGRVSLLVFIDEVLAFWIYWFVLAVFNDRLVVPTLFSSGLSIFTVYTLLAYRFKRQLPVSRMSEQRASVD
jgi:hypothetical protein